MTKSAAADKWTEAEARRVLAERKASGLSIRAFAERRGLRPQRLYWWSKRLTTTSPAITVVPLPRLVPVVLKAGVSKARQGPAAISVRVGASVTMEIADPAAATPAWVAAVMAELERLSCS
jgi:hypothetical protein